MAPGGRESGPALSQSMSSKPSAGNRPGDDAPRGLPSITQAREDRRKRKSMLPARFWMWAAVLFGAALIVWWKIEQGEINSMRNELLGKQRAAVEELGPRWFPLRDKIEGWTTECAREAFVEHIDDEIKNGKWEFRRDAGIYLRLAQPSAATPDSMVLFHDRDLAAPLGQLHRRTFTSWAGTDEYHIVIIGIHGNFAFTERLNKPISGESCF